MIIRVVRLRIIGQQELRIAFFAEDDGETI